MRKILLVDHHDSFTYNLVDDLKTLGFNVETVYPEAAVSAALAASPDLILLSAGHGNPANMPHSLNVINTFSGQIPMLGICLGFQLLVHAFGGEVKPMPTPIHGKRSELLLREHPLFTALPESIAIGRYHSLAATAIPAEMSVLAETSDGVPMIVASEEKQAVGFQFHPESILTEHGLQLLKNAAAVLLGETYATHAS